MTENATTGIVVITGAGGDIGAATARSFAELGHSLALFDRKASLLDDIAAECASLGAACGAEVSTHGVDQTDPEAVSGGIAAVVERFGTIDVLFANAGYGKFAPFLDQPLTEWRRHVDINLTGTFLICQQVARVMAAGRHGGSIVVNASSGAVQYTDLLGAYCATKSALAMLVRAMASELGAYQIRVNAVLPGVIETGMTAPMLGSNEEQAASLKRSTPLGRLGVPADIARVVQFLASDAASYITGQSIGVDGGQTILGQPQWYVSDRREAFSSDWVAAQ
jgi:NAD(P)-dependent dehydrogenase (short-subunit alcohol dehydrogenase family)